MAVTKDDVRQMAALARLGLDEDRVQSLVQELNGILVHMDVLQQVDVTTEPLTPPELTAPLRPDGVLPVALFRSRETFAPAMRDGFFLVPRLATHGSHGASADEGVSQ